MADGYEYNQELEMQKLAWHAANVMNVHLKKQVTVKKLLGKEKKPMTQAQREAEFQKLMNAIQGRGVDDGTDRGNHSQD